MKKMLLAALLFCGAYTGYAQSEGAIRLGVTGGMNVSKVTDVHADCRIGFNLGGRLEYGLTDHMYAGTGLLLSLKGFEYDDANELRGNPLYLEVPIHVGYRYALSDGLALFGETGPYLAFGLSGKLKQNEKELGEPKVDYFDNEMANRFDLGWGIRLGVEVSHLQIHMGYDYGFIKIFDSVFGKSSNHNANFSVGVSYFF